MTLAIFDLDNTLLNGDSDYLWGNYLVSQGIVDAESYKKENQRFFEEYQAGKLDIYEFQAFSLAPMIPMSAAQRNKLHNSYMQEVIKPLITDASRKLIARHQEAGHTLIIITSTNHFITAPIAKELGIDHILATDPEIIDDQFTGKIIGIPCYREGKVTRLHNWLKSTGNNLSDSWFYSDSHNDLPLLELVTHPVAVDPDDTLNTHAVAKGWTILSLQESKIKTIQS
jgi:HAD superfamily hydrolase (TIGR01490 family)